jgi:Protein of unknown function (DUF4236)
MSLQYRRSKTIAPGTRLNVSKSGLSVSKRVGPLTLNSRGRGSLRIAPGMSYRFGKKNSGTAALVMLAVALAILAVQIALLLLQALFVIAMWLARWAWFGTSALVERAQAQRGLKAAEKAQSGRSGAD